MDRSKARKIAVRLSQGETIDRKEFAGLFEIVECCLREIKNNCNMVLRQLKDR